MISINAFPDAAQRRSGIFDPALKSRGIAPRGSRARTSPGRDNFRGTVCQAAFTDLIAYTS